jgi:hypothetical protein
MAFRFPWPQNRGNLLIAFVYVLLFVYAVHIYRKGRSQEQSQFQAQLFDTNRWEPPKDEIQILYWTAMWGSYPWGYGRVPFMGCKGQAAKCRLVTERSLLEQGANVLLFHGPDINMGDIPARKPNQKWIYHTMEPPWVQNQQGKVRKLQDKFNITMTYRLDSTIPSPWGLCHKNKTEEPHAMGFGKLTPFAEKAGSGAVWFSSFCPSPGRREQYIKELQKHIPVDIYGSCGDSKCPRNDPKCKTEMVDKNYKFYLVLENSWCEDYIINNLFSFLHGGARAIPVVLGLSDYSKILPPNSHINIENYNSPEELGNFLNELANDEKAFLKYFEWREKYTCFPIGWSSGEHRLCPLCEYLHKNKDRTETVDMVNHFGGGTCQNAREFFTQFSNFIPT